MFTIAPASDADFSDVTTLLGTAGLPAGDLTGQHLEHFRILRDDDRLCGIVGLEVFGPVGLLRSLVVHPDVRGSGYGQALVLEVEAYGRSQLVSALYLLTTTATAFFERLGYSVIDRDLVPPEVAASPEFDRLCPSDATCMWKQLSAG